MRAAGGFVYVYGGTYLKKHRSAILSPFPMDASGRDNGRIDNKKTGSLYLYSRQVKVLGVFLSRRGKNPPMIQFDADNGTDRYQLAKIAP